MKIPVSPPEVDSLFEQVIESDFRNVFFKHMTPLDSKGRYLHWDDLRYKSPPEGFSIEMYWAAKKIARRTNYIHLPLKNKKNEVFVFCVPDNVQEKLHMIDQRASGNITMDHAVTNVHTRKYYRVTSLLEEAVRSSQLEGATTTRRRAKEMIREGKEPVDRNDRMVLNNYHAMEFIRRRTEDPLTPKLILDLHQILTEGTLDNPEKAGRLRDSTDDIHVMNRDASRILHTPPAAQELPERLKRLCDFANGDTKASAFVHPVIGAVILHFMIGYDHPFVDGNGRTARAIFYWAMARSGYWMMEFLSISGVIKEKATQYGRAYLHTETDENDVTYFIIHQLDVILTAIARLEDHIRKKMMEAETVEELLEELLEDPNIADHFTSRHLALLRHAFKHPGAIYTIAEYQRYHKVAYQTARTDLLFLSDQMKLLRKRKEGRAYIFVAPMNLRARVEKVKRQTRR